MGKKYLEYHPISHWLMVQSNENTLKLLCICQAFYKKLYFYNGGNSSQISHDYNSINMVTLSIYLNVSRLYFYFFTRLTDFCLNLLDVLENVSILFLKYPFNVRFCRKKSLDYLWIYGINIVKI